jgi:hypothetical protein
LTIMSMTGSWLTHGRIPTAILFLLTSNPRRIGPVDNDLVRSS